MVSLLRFLTMAAVMLRARSLNYAYACANNDTCVSGGGEGGGVGVVTQFEIASSARGDYACSHLIPQTQCRYAVARARYVCTILM